MSSLELRILHFLCVSLLGSKDISLIKVSDFLRADDCVILSVCRENEQKPPYGVRMLSGTSLLPFFTRKPEGSLE